LANFSLELTPKALANFSPGFEEREPWDRQSISVLTLKGLGGWRTLFRVDLEFWFQTQGSRSSNPGIANQSQVSTLKGFGGWRTLSGLFFLLNRTPRVLVPRTLG
jgi:hypothetical protein